MRRFRMAVRGYVISADVHMNALNNSCGRMYL
jgi:hypothetical protein